MARASCDECGLLFETLSDLQNHVQNWCYGQSDRKRPRLESQSSEERENDNNAFINMANILRMVSQMVSSRSQFHPSLVSGRVCWHCACGEPLPSHSLFEMSCSHGIHNVEGAGMLL